MVAGNSINKLSDYFRGQLAFKYKKYNKDIIMTLKKKQIRWKISLWVCCIVSFKNFTYLPLFLQGFILGVESEKECPKSMRIRKVETGP